MTPKLELVFLFRLRRMAQRLASIGVDHESLFAMLRGWIYQKYGLRMSAGELHRRIGLIRGRNSGLPIPNTSNVIWVLNQSKAMLSQMATRGAIHEIIADLRRDRLKLGWEAPVAPETVELAVRVFNEEQPKVRLAA